MNRGSLNLVADTICRRSLVSVYSDGEFRVNCHWLNENVLTEQVRDNLVDEISHLLGRERPIDVSRDRFKVNPVDWCDKADALVSILKQSVDRHTPHG